MAKTSTVSTLSDAFMLQRRDMRLTHDLMGGTQAMMRAGERYLPRKQGESDKAYEARIGRTVLLNAYKRTVRFSRGQVFKRPVVIEDAEQDSILPQSSVDWFKAWAEDVDRNGNSLTDWGGDVFEAGVNDGVTFCLVDYSSVPTMIDERGQVAYRDNDGSIRLKTAEADKEHGWGPYLIHVKAEQVLEARTEKVNGEFRIVHFRYVETFETVLDEWTTEYRQRIRVFTPGAYQVWENGANLSATFDLVEEGSMLDEQGRALSYVPVCIFMPGDKRTDVTAEPALIDLADLNRRYWQAYCAQCELMEFARFPVWFGKQLTSEKDSTLRFGPGVLINATADYASLDSRGVDASSVESGRLELEDLENKMSMYGLQLLQSKIDNAATATEVNQDTEESVSTLEDWAMRFQNFLENCLRLVALWKCWEDGPGVKVNSEIARVVNVSLLLSLQERGILSKRSLLAQFKRAGILPDDFDIDAELDNVEQELNTASGASGSFKLSSILERAGNNQTQPQKQNNSPAMVEEI